MPIEITMPRLSDTMEQGTLVSWNVKEGDSVSAGDVLGDIETDKATMELQNFDDGVVAAVLLGEGETVEVGKAIMILAEEGEDPAEVKQNAMAGAAAGGGGSGGGASGGGASAGGAADADTGAGTEQASGPGQPTGGDAEQRTQQDTLADQRAAQGAAAAGNGHAAAHAELGAAAGDRAGRIFASPLAKKIAKERGVDLTRVRGTGPSGRIVQKDVEQFVEAGGATAGPAAEPMQVPSYGPAPQPLPMPGSTLEDSTIALNNMRATIAKRLLESKQSSPHYYVTVKVRADALLALRSELNEQLAGQGVKLTVNDFIVRAAALSLHDHPFVNASWGSDGKSIKLHGAVNVGVAIALPGAAGGLVVATMRNADQIGLRQISAETKRLAAKARDKGLSIEEMADATFTISNLGMYGVAHYTAIINPPNSSILAVGSAQKQPIVDENDDIVVGSMMDLTLSSDHRVIDGAMAAQYLQTLRSYLEKPATLLV